MAVFYSISFATQIAETLRDRMALGGTIEIYNGARPVTPDTAVTSQTLLVEFEVPAPGFSAPVFDAANNRIVMTGNPIENEVAVSSGIALWGRMKDSDGAVVYDGNVGTLTTDAFFRIADTNISAGSAIRIASHVFFQPKA